MMEMVMEAAQEAIGSNMEIAQIIKGKRTKRQRGASPTLLPMTTATTSSSYLGGGERERISNNNSTLSPSTSVEFAESTGEEEDMANCLILLAQGHHQTRKESEHTPVAAAINNIPAATNTGKASSSSAGLYVYQCKTCNRCFPSFQALGGHRASHKKPKVNNEGKKPTFMVMEDAIEEDHRLNNMSTALSLQITNRATLLCSNIKSNKVHECSICGAEFSSGQALGGHMRRHRGFVTANTTSTATPTTTTTTLSLVSSSPESHQEPKKPKTTSLELDLNLPAPEDHDHVQDSKFHFSSSKEQVVVFCASPLVDCHY